MIEYQSGNESDDIEEQNGCQFRLNYRSVSKITQ
jgi:hypothetical protein